MTVILMKKPGVANKTYYRINHLQDTAENKQNPALLTRYINERLAHATER